MVAMHPGIALLQVGYELAWPARPASESGWMQVSEDHEQERSLQSYVHNSRYEDSETDSENFELMEVFSTFMNALVVICITTAIGYQYKTTVTNRRALFPEPVPAEWKISNNNGEWHYGIFDCCGDCQYTIHAYFLTEVRVGDTYHAVGLANFWVPHIIWLTAYAFSQVLSAAFIYVVRSKFPKSGLDGASSLLFYGPQFLVAFYFANLRGKLRRRLGGDSDQFLTDFLLWWCCSCCATVQEARQVDGASGTRVECCCSLLMLYPQNVDAFVYGNQQHGPGGTINGMQMNGSTVVVGQVVQVGGTGTATAPGSKKGELPMATVVAAQVVSSPQTNNVVAAQTVPSQQRE
eukprot:TRINITY_DN89602_c0_g1_i1.p1 TRINITY_DN89602_c0_g1~~TRINITY_DN89602_c0_g1_i1.p1  ORF type:complete len:367 (-),score=47.51 TRINITY_DN89602_c0_g1_i1:96-1142(-)